MLVELGDKGFLSLPVSILVCAKDSPSSFNQCSPPGADLAWVDLEPASYLCCGLLTFECLKGYLSLKGGAVLLATLLLLLFLRAYFVILGAGTDLSYLSEILGPSHPIKGIVMAGIPRDRYDVEYGNIGWPDISPIGHYPGAFALVVSGDECASDGIHDLDLVFVEPGGYQGFPADIGSTDIGKLHVVRIDGIPLICRVIAEGVLRSSDGGVQRFEASKMEILGKVAFHLRRIQ